jgi:molecular chaperone GrpE
MSKTKDHFKKTEEQTIPVNQEEKAASTNTSTVNPTGEPVSANKNMADQEQTTAEEFVTIPSKEFALYQEEMDKAQKQAKEHFEGWQRERADFTNYKKRIERENSLATQSIKGDIIKKYLPVLDDLSRAIKSRPEQGEGAAWAEGIELIFRKFQKIIETEGVTRIPAENQTFDPNFHEAISHEDHPDLSSGAIIEVVQDGYMLGERVLRPALVRVAK